MNTCVNCGSVLGYVFVDKFIDIYENMYKIRKKSVYCRKYYIENVMNSISFELTHEQINQIHEVFVEIDSVQNKINDGRKRMISVKFIMKQLFKMLGLPYKDINVTKSKRTLKYYKQYWEKVQSLIGDRIQSIINM